MASNIPGPTASTPLLHAHRAATFPASPRDQSPNPHIPRPSPSLSPNRIFVKPRKHIAHHVSLIPIIFLFGVIILIAFAAWDVSSVGDCYLPSLCKALGKGRYRPEEVWLRNIGAYAPYFPKGDGGGKINLPRGCEIDQVNILHRHTARYPTTGAGVCMKRTLQKIANRKVKEPKRHSEWAFLDKADLTLKDWKFDELMNQGRRAAWRSGREFSAIYKSSLEHGKATFSRSAGGARVVETGRYWMQGYTGHAFKISPLATLPDLDLIIPEGETVNSTLSVHNCPAYESLDPSAGMPERKALYPFLDPILHRINTILSPHPKLDVEDLICLSDMCAFDSQASSTEFSGFSRWCDVFEKSEWDVLGYVRDVERFYEVGHGGKYGKTMGAGWINELIARLMDSEVVDSTTTNRTLDQDEKTFPRGGKRLFVDFTHDNEMVEIISAMNILPQHRPLPINRIPRKRTFQLSNIIPFGARLVVERIACDLADWEPDPGDGSDPDGKRDGDGKKDYVRIFLNDKLYPVEYIDCKQSGFVEHGMCEVEAFLASQSWATEEVDWNLCYE